MRGKFIVIDGGEGTGTTTMTKYLADVYGEKAIRTREPGGSPTAERIRSEIILSEAGKRFSPRMMAALFWAARYDHVEETIEPARAKGLHVFCDRFDSSTWAYQIIADNGADLIMSFFTHRAHLTYCNQLPTHYIILDGDPEVCLARAKRRAQLTGEAATHFDEREFAYHHKVRKGFLEFVLREPPAIIDATRPIDEVKAEVLKIAQSIIGY